MERLWRYYSGFQRARGGVGGLPSWARAVLVIVALPGIVAIALSILAFLVSLIALLLLAVPAYSLMKALTGTRQPDATGGSVIVERGDGFDSPGRKRVEATIIDPAD